MKKAKGANRSKTKKRGSFAKNVRVHLVALEKKTGQKRNELSRLVKKEETLEKRIEEGLQRLISVETKKVVRAKKSKDKNQKKFQESLKEFKERHQEFLRRSMIVERLRARQKILQQRIQKMKKFVSTHAPRIAIEQQKEMQKTIQETVTEPSVSIAETKEPTILETEEPSIELEEETQEPSPAETTEEETIQPLEEETREEWTAEPAAEKPVVPAEEQPPSEPTTEPGFKQFAMDGISFIHPDWPQSSMRSVGAIFSVEMDQLRFELFSFAADARLTLEQNTQKTLQSIPDLEIVSQENINHYMFVTYLITEGENLVKHYALFAQVENQLYKIEANGEPDKLDEQSALIVKVFKSFAVEEE